MLCVKVALVPVVFDAATDWPFTVPKALLSHALAYSLVALLVALAVRFGASIVVRSPLHIPVLAYLAASAIATIFAADRYTAMFGTHDRMLGLASIADWVVLYFAVTVLVRTRRDATAIAVAVFGAAVVVLGYELVQLTGRDPIRWSIEGTFAAFSTIGQPTSLGQYTSSLAIGAFAIALLAPGLRLPVRVLFIALAVALLWGAAKTDSRAPIVGLASGSVALVLGLWLTRRGARGARVVALTAGAAVIALVALLVFTPIGARVTSTLQVIESGDSGQVARLDPSTASRVAIYQIGLAEFLERPLVGYGPDNFVIGVPRHRATPTTVELRQSLATSAHSWLVQTGASSGVLGLGSLLATFVLTAALVVRTRSEIALVPVATLAAYLGTGLVTIDDLASGWIPWCCLGLVAAATAPRPVAAAPTQHTRRQRASRDRVPRLSDAQRVGIAVALAVAALAPLAVIPAYSAARATKTSADLLNSGNAAASIAQANSSVQSDPSRAEYWHVLGLGHVAVSNWRDATRSFDQAAVHAPYDVRNLGDEISAMLATGDETLRPRARDLAQQMVRTDPNNPYAQRILATTLAYLGSAADAVTPIGRALALDPGSSNQSLYIAAAQVYMAAGRPADAERAARDGLAIIDRVEVTARAVPLRYEHARALAALGQTADALKELDLVLALQPGNTAAQQLRAQLR